MVRIIFVLTFCFLVVADSFCIADEAQQRIIERYKEILVKSPKRGTTFDRVYGYYVDTGQIAVFYQECQSAAQAKPDDAKTHILFGLVAEQQNQIAESAAAFQAAGKLEPDNFLPMFYLGELLLNQRQQNEAIAALEQASERLQNNQGSKNDLRTVLQTLALAYTRTGNAQKSLEIWNQLSDLFPSDPEVLAHIAETLSSEGKLDEAILHYRRLINITHEPAERVRLTLAVIDILIRQGNSDAAKNESALNELETLLGSLDSESYLADAVRNRIDGLFERLNDINRQIEFYRKRIEKVPNDTYSLRRIVQTLLRSDKYAEAEKLLLNSIKAAPSNVTIRLTLIDLLTNRKEIGKAVEQFQAIDAIAPLETEQIVRWGTLVLQHPALPESARRSEAVKIWNRITKQSPNDPNVCILAADLFANHQINDEAEHCYKQAIVLRPSEFSYRESLAAFYHKQNRKNDVLAVFQARQQNHIAEVGQLLLTWGYLAEAEQMLQQAVQAEPANATLQSRHLETLLRLNTPESFVEVTKLLNDVEKKITDAEQFALFLQNEVRLLQSAQKLGEAMGIVQSQLEKTSSPRTLWHLAALQQAAGMFPAAVATIENVLKQDVLQQDSAPLPLLRFAAELYEKSGSTVKAIALYQKLVHDDPARSGNYWQQIITLHVQQGELPLALETSQKLLGHGTENAERLLFVAELYLSANRQSECVKLLRQALVLEPNNTDALRMLAQTLADSEQHIEAIELLWQLYEKLEHVPAKLSAIELLATEYSTLGRDDVLVERLQQLSQNIERRPEAMQALARVFFVQNKADQARDILLDLLDLPVEVKDETESITHWTLRELVAVNERLNDFPAALRYQEMLCQKVSDPIEQNHLFFLYDRAGDETKRNKLFFDQVLLQGNWQGRFELIDRMIVRGEYDLVSQALDFLSIHESEHWGIAYRKILVEAYQNKPVENLVKRFQAMQVTESATAPPIAWTDASVRVSRSFMFLDVASDEWFRATRLQDQFLTVLFYPELQKHDSMRGKSLASLCDIQTYHDARFLVHGFALREAINKDLQATTDNPQVWRQFRHTVEELRNKLPIDSSKVDIVLERVRFEVMLLDLIQFDEWYQVFPKGLVDLQIDQRLCQQTIWQIIRKLALDGSPDWQPALFQIFVTECINEIIADRFKAVLTSDAKLSNTLVQILDNLCFARQVPPISADERNKMINQAIFLIKQSVIDHQESRKKNPITLAQKTDKLLTLWKSFIENAGPNTRERYQYPFVVRYETFLWILRAQNREADAQALEASLLKTVKNDPIWFAEHIICFMQSMNEDLLLFPSLAANEPLETRLLRVKSRIVEVLPSLTDKQMNLMFGDILCQYLSDCLTPERLQRYEFQTSITPDQMKRLAELDLSLQQLAEFMFQVFGDLKITPEDFAPAAAAPTEPKIALSRYRQELQGDRPIDRSIIFTLLKKPDSAGQVPAVDDLFLRIFQIRRELTVRTAGKIAGDYTEPLRQFLEQKKHSTVEFDRHWSRYITQSLGNHLQVNTLSQGQPAEQNSNGELLQLASGLESVRKEHTLSSAELTALALLYVRLQKFPEAVKMLDLMEITDPLDLQVREWIAAGLAIKQAKTDTTLKQRGSEAASRLLNFRLSDRDSLTLVSMLKQFDRAEESQQLWDRLADAVTDRRLVGEMLQKTMAGGDSQKANAAKLSRRILLNPALMQNIRRLTAEVNMLTSAVNVLREQNLLEPVLPIVENRLKGLPNKTDSLLLLTKLYLVLGRQEEAKALTLELSQNPTSEPERRQMIVSLLIQFDMQKELENMNRILLEKR